MDLRLYDSVGVMVSDLIQREVSLLQLLIHVMYFAVCHIWFPCLQTPSSVFWKELALAMPRHVVFHSESAGDPQTMLQDDKDPMLTLDPDYLDCRADADPAGDLGKNVDVLECLC